MLVRGIRTSKLAIRDALQPGHTTRLRDITRYLSHAYEMLRIQETMNTWPGSDVHTGWSTLEKRLFGADSALSPVLRRALCCTRPSYMTMLLHPFLSKRCSALLQHGRRRLHGAAAAVLITPPGTAHNAFRQSAVSSSAGDPAPGLYDPRRQQREGSEERPAAEKGAYAAVPSVAGATPSCSHPPPVAQPPQRSPASSALRQPPRLPQGLSKLHLQVMQTIRSKELIKPDASILLAVSGGQASHHSPRVSG